MTTGTEPNMGKQEPKPEQKTKITFFGVFAPQELGTYLVLGTLFGGTKLAPTSE